MSRRRDDPRHETPGAARNRERKAEGQPQRGRPPWPKGLPRELIEADDIPDDGDER